MNQNALGNSTRRKEHLSLNSALKRTYADCIANTEKRYLPHTRHLAGTDVGFVIIKVWISYGCYEKTTPKDGHCFSSGIRIVLLHFIPMDTRYTISTTDFNVRTRDYYRTIKRSVGRCLTRYNLNFFRRIHNGNQN